MFLSWCGGLDTAKMSEVGDFVVFSDNNFIDNENYSQHRKKSMLSAASRILQNQESGQGQRRSALSCITNSVENGVLLPLRQFRVCILITEMLKQPLVA
jgi:hypothetical protein